MARVSEEAKLHYKFNFFDLYSQPDLNKVKTTSNPLGMDELKSEDNYGQRCQCEAGKSWAGF